MGRYCEVYGVETKFRGLLAVAASEVIGQERARAAGVVLTREEVQDVLRVMRFKILAGWACEANGWSQDGDPLIYLQDIMTYATDITTFERLAAWLVYTDEEELVWT